MSERRIGCAFPWCHQPRSDRLRAPLCPDHARAVYLEVKDMVENASVMERIASARESKTTKRPHYTVEQGHVYFAEIGAFIKIGFSTNVRQRMSQLGGKVLLTIPGTLQTEKAMQARFGPSWSHGEYFQPTPELLAFIAERAA